MKHILLSCSAAAALLGAVPTAFAQASGFDAAQSAAPERPMSRREMRRNSGFDVDRAYYDAREFQRGQYLPFQLRGRNYIVDDWRGHRLDRPPQGHQWVQVGADYVLVAIATGLIVQMVLNNR
jgi:Ni/Co efflux regulator RcnB